MTAPEISTMHTTYQTMQPLFEPLRTSIALGYAIVVLSDFCCEVTGRYLRAGVKPMRVVYLESRPWASAFAWLVLHAFFVRTVLAGGRWWLPALFLLGFGVFLGERVVRAIRFGTKHKE